VTVAFSQRRKLLRHTLGRWIERAAAAGREFDLQRRAEEVPVAEYLALARLPGLSRRPAPKKRPLALPRARALSFG
jgi:16S rRNA A1518/A1519 N6-dimethyltransferase RsmA/KsgA/DIM1 with predicted DNA glycosylase/AP lyase activity